MNLTKCKNGHYYDADKYPNCPHCTGGVNTDDDVTVNMEQTGTTIAFLGFYDNFVIICLSLLYLIIKKGCFFRAFYYFQPYKSSIFLSGTINGIGFCCC